jgi:hypothetical protein
MTSKNNAAQSADAEPSAEALAIFERLKSTVTQAMLLTLRDDIDRHLLQLQKLASKNEMTPIDLAQALAAALHTLLGELERFAPEHQVDIIGAALYFVSTEDLLSDTESILGLDDDAAVFNHVAAKVGRGDLRVEL